MSALLEIALRLRGRTGIYEEPDICLNDLSTVSSEFTQFDGANWRTFPALTVDAPLFILPSVEFAVVIADKPIDLKTALLGSVLALAPFRVDGQVFWMGTFGAGVTNVYITTAALTRVWAFGAKR